MHINPHPENTHLFNTLMDVAGYRWYETFILNVMSHPAVSFRDTFCVSRKGGRVGGCTERLQTAWLCPGLALKNP